MSAEQKNLPPPFILVIFGATGDLTRRKLIPGVFNLFRQGLLPARFAVLGFARREKDDALFREEMRAAVQSASHRFDAGAWERFCGRIFYHRASFDDPAGFSALRARLDEIAAGQGMPCNCLYYLAVQPGQIETILAQINAAGLDRRIAADRSWPRVVVEKPFGRDLASARRLNRLIAAQFDEQQVFRIDHYLGKETVQNILVLRFANSIFEPIWNQKYVDHVQITVSETLGVEGRGAYYEQAGAIRDILQNHMMHLFSLVAMESPTCLDADAVRDEKVKALQALRPMPPACLTRELVRGQYAAGAIGGRAVAGYRQEPGVSPDSATETYVALKAFVDNWRWAGVPFYLRAGKRMPARITQIDIHFKETPRILFNTSDSPLAPNVLALRIQPNEGVTLRFEVKAPGAAMVIKPFQMNFGYAEAFGKQPPEAYERLLLDAALGDPTLFTRKDEAEEAWRFVGPILDACREQSGQSLPSYQAGSWGPREADDMIAADGRRWEILSLPVYNPAAGREAEHQAAPPSG